MRTIHKVKESTIDYTKYINKEIRDNDLVYIIIKADSQGSSPYWKLDVKEITK